MDNRPGNGIATIQLRTVQKINVLDQTMKIKSAICKYVAIIPIGPAGELGEPVLKPVEMDNKPDNVSATIQLQTVLERFALDQIVKVQCAELSSVRLLLHHLAVIVFVHNFDILNPFALDIYLKTNRLIFNIIIRVLFLYYISISFVAQKTKQNKN